MGHVYNDAFYDYINAGSRASAKVVIPFMQLALNVESLLDVGAGVGAWAAEWIAGGVRDVVAVDGDYAKALKLLVPDDCFVAHDLGQPLDLGRRFDLVQTLEVAEHLPAEKADAFVASLVRHGDVVLFSAAVPGQGGEHHVNEQHPEYWRQKFAAHGYACFDWLRPQIADHADVQPWYRYNSLIFANAAGEARLADGVRAARVPEGEKVRMAGSFGWHLRRAIVGMMPETLVMGIATANARRKAAAARRLAA